MRRFNIGLQTGSFESGAVLKARSARVVLARERRSREVSIAGRSVVVATHPARYHQKKNRDLGKPEAAVIRFF